MSLHNVPQPIPRGATVQFKTTFHDADGNVTQPNAAVVNIVFSTPEDDEASIQIAMTPPSPGGTEWVAQWDSRGALAPRTVSWSIHSDPPTPVSVEDGQFPLVANGANLLTF